MRAQITHEIKRKIYWLKHCKAALQLHPETLPAAAKTSQGCRRLPLHARRGQKAIQERKGLTGAGAANKGLVFTWKQIALHNELDNLKPVMLSCQIRKCHSKMSTCLVVAVRQNQSSETRYMFRRHVMRCLDMFVLDFSDGKPSVIWTDRYRAAVT